MSEALTTRIYGASDDLIEFDGEYRGEVGASGTDDREKGALVICSDGTVAEVKYGKGGRGIWAITLLQKGTLFQGIDPCTDEDADVYSDVLALASGVKWIYTATDN